MGGTMDVSVQSAGEDGVTRIRVAGEMDLANSDEFHAAVQRCLDDPPCKQVRVDLSGVRFCDSTGLGTLVDVRQECERRGVELVLESPSDRVHRVIELTGLEGMFLIDDSN